MKKFLVLALATLSFTAFANYEVYSGNDNGAACELRLNLNKKFAAVNDCGVVGSKRFSNDGRQLVVEGSVDFTDCRITVALKNSVPVSAELKTKGGLSPVYKKAVLCRDLKRVR